MKYISELFKKSGFLILLVILSGAIFKEFGEYTDQSNYNMVMGSLFAMLLTVIITVFKKGFDLGLVMLVFFAYPPLVYFSHTLLSLSATTVSIVYYLGVLGMAAHTVFTVWKNVSVTNRIA